MELNLCNEELFIVLCVDDCARFSKRTSLVDSTVCTNATFVFLRRGIDKRERWTFGFNSCVLSQMLNAHCENARKSNNSWLDSESNFIDICFDHLIRVI